MQNTKIAARTWLHKAWLTKHGVVQSSQTQGKPESGPVGSSTSVLNSQACPPWRAVPLSQSEIHSSSVKFELIFD
jgi:hypothetical protein